MQRRRRRNVARLAVLLAMSAALVGVVGSAQAVDPDQKAIAVANAVNSFADRLSSASDSLGEYSDLANNLPLTDLAPGDPDALDLSNLLKDRLVDLADHDDTMGGLAAYIEGLDDDSGALKIQFGTDATAPIAPAQGPVTFTATSITIPVHAERLVNEPLQFAFGPNVDMAGGSLGVDFELDTTLTFNVDPSLASAASAPPTALWVTGATTSAPPRIDLCARATGSVGLFTARFGFTDVKLSTDNPVPAGGAVETAKLHLCADVVFSDPDSTGGITLDEWGSHALTELATAEIVDGNSAGDGKDLDLTLYADASLVNGDAFATNTTPDASIQFSDADLSDGFSATPTPTVSPGLQAWLNVSAGDVANGLAQFVSSFAAAQGFGNAPLPLINRSLTEVVEGAAPLVDAVKPLLDYAQQLTNATVGCGTNPGDATHFPTGLTDNLTINTRVYCRAQTPGPATGVDWDVATGVSAIVETNETSTSTIGEDPTADAVFKMTAPGNFSAIAKFTVGGVAKTAIPRPGTAQELFARLASAAGLDNAAANLGYNAEKKALTFKLSPTTKLNPAKQAVDANIGDLLRNKTNLAGLKEATGSLEADVDGIDFDLTFGVLLTPNTSDITPIRGTTTAGSGLTLTHAGAEPANFTDGVNDPQLGQILRKTNGVPAGQEPPKCPIASMTATTLTCATGSSITWAAGDTYDVDGGLVDRFYIGIDPAGAELSVDNLTLTGDATLKGTLGFLEIEAGGNGGKNTYSPGKAFEIAKPAGAAHVLRVDIKVPGASPLTVDEGGPTPTTIGDAIGVGDLLANLDSARVEASCNLKATAGLGISAKVDGNVLASGSVAVNWPSVFEASSCKPDFGSIAVNADTDFNVNLRDFDPFPSPTGKHTAATATNLFDITKDFQKVGFTPGAAPSPDGGNRLLQLTLRNKTTGASCTIATISAQELLCDLSGGTRAGDDATKNKWKTGDEYEVEGNALAWLGYILENLDKVVAEIDKIDGDLTDKELPLVGMSTKDLVNKIKSIKQTMDEIRGAPLAQVDCTQHADGTSAAGFDPTSLVRGTTIHCRAVTTVAPDTVKWTVVKNPGGDNIVSLGANQDNVSTVGASPTARVEVVVGDATKVPASGPMPSISLSDWQIKAEFTDAAGNHNVELPTSSPPSSLQELEQLIAEKLGVPNVVTFDMFDLPAAGAAPRTTGTATGGSTADNVLEDSGENFPSNAEASRPFIGNLLINKTDKKQCTITAVGTDTLTCAPGSGMQWSASDEYQVVGDNTKDLVVRLGVGFCSGGGVVCEATDRTSPALQAPLNVAGSFADLVAVQTQGDVALDYDVSAQLDIGISLKLGVPDVVVLDTSGLSLEASLNANDIGLNASLGPFEVTLGTSITDTDPSTADDPNDPEDDQPGVGIGKLGAALKLGNDDDEWANNKTRTFGAFLSSIPSSFSFTGTDQECDAPAGDPVEAEGHACALLHVQASIADVATTFEDPIVVECDLEDDPICSFTLPGDLQSLLEGEPFDWTELLKILPQILTKLEQSLDGAAQGTKLPLVGNALDAGANVAAAFRDEIVTPFNQLADDLTEATDEDGDDDTDAWDLSKLTRQFILDEVGGAGLLRDTNGIDPNGPGTVDDIVVTPLCGNALEVCEDGAGVLTNFVRDFRITFKIGQGITGELPFDVGLEGLPLRLQGNIQGGGSWSYLVDFGLSLKDGPYIVAKGKKGFTGTEKRPKDVETNDPPEAPADEWSVQKSLRDDDTDFNGASNTDRADDLVELGMWLHNTTEDEGCRVTKVEEHVLWCDDFGTADVEGVDWSGEDEYELRARHGHDTPAGGASDPDAQPELNLDANVTMGDAPAACDDATGLPTYLAGYSVNQRCLRGQIAFLQVQVRDRDVDLNCATLATDNRQQTALCLNASLDFRNASSARITFSEVIAGNVNVSPKLVGKANVDVRLRTGIAGGQSAGFPSVLGKFHLFWGFTVAPLESKKLVFEDLDIAFDGLALDAGKFITDFLGPMIKQVKDVTNPLMPVVELIQGEVPIISDLSKLVGQGPVTVLDLLEAISGNDLSLLRSILQMIKFVNSLPTNGPLVIPLGATPGEPGSFKVTGKRAGESQPIPEKAAEGMTNKVAGKDLINELGKPGSPYSAAKTTAAACNRGSTFGVCGLTFPFFGDASQIFGVLMGQDATLVHYDAGSFGAGAGFGFCFPPIIIGPVPVQICIGGSFRVEGRFAMGYDTSGLRKVLAGGQGTHLLDGIYFDDYDASGADVPEVKFTGRVYAEGAVSVYIFKVGIRGEIIFTTGLNLHEDDPRDGKLRIEEIISKIFNPICLFDIEGKIEAALSAFVKIDLFITSVEFSIQIVKVTLLEFNLSVCNVKPVLAKNEGDNLRLLMGSSGRRNERGIAPGEINEKFIVRQMEASGTQTRFSVSAFGIQQDYYLATAKVIAGTARIVADAEDGADSISLLPGSAQGETANPDQQKPPIAFVAGATITGGTGDDEITTADGADNVNGGGEHDSLTTGGAVDVVAGGAGNDKIDAGADADVDVQGNDGNDIVNGGPGADKLFGNANDDILSGGPGDSGSSVDEMTGGPGNDTLNADGGGDKLWGDEGSLSFSCTADTGNDGSTSTTTGNGRDSLLGAKGADQMHGGNNDDTLDGGDDNDTMCGGGGNDELKGGAGADPMSGNGGDDNMVGSTDGGAGDTMNGNGGRDYMIGDDGTLTRDGSNNVTETIAPGTAGGTDAMNGGPGRDFMWGQGAVDTMNGNAGNDYMLGGPANDSMRGDLAAGESCGGSGVACGDDEMHGEDGVDTMSGHSGNDYMRGGPLDDTMNGDADFDEMYGDGEVDTMKGGADDDLMRGGGGNDKIEGNGNFSSARTLDSTSNPLANLNFDLHLVKNNTTGAWVKTDGNDGDVIYGDAGQDNIVGGSATASADDGDTILGNTEQDVILGDNGTIVTTSTTPAGDGTLPRTVTLSDPGGSTAANSGPDWIQGNDEDDDVYAGGGDDLVHGDLGDDYVEGNGGSDGANALGGPPVAHVGLYGDAGQDDLIGGTSQSSGGVLDGGDDVWGGQGEDVVAGDNATITRTAGGTCDDWVCNTFRGDVVGVVIRKVQLWDVAVSGATAPATTLSGGDTIDGQDAHDRLYGQGGGDHIKGSGNDDFAFGNAGADTILGGDGQDDLVGGTGRTDSSSPSSASDGRLDDGDVIQGQDNYDAISGDNARVVRQTNDSDANDNTGEWKSNTFNGAVDRLLALMDVATTANAAPLTNGTSGNDQLLGGDEDDVVYGQGGNDGISGGPAQDMLEGNANGTGNAPDPAESYGGSWPTFAGDVVHGDDGADDVSGGTGRIYKMEDVGGVMTEVQDPAAGVDGRRDGGDTLFGDGGSDALAGDNTVIERPLFENAWVLDDLRSDAQDVVRRVFRERDVATSQNLGPLTDGTSGGDVIEGNADFDVAYGQGGNDDIHGNDGDDHLEGNAGDDTVDGDAGQDDIVGGTGRTISNDGTTSVDGRIDDSDPADANDVLTGDLAEDVILGDNGTIDRFPFDLTTYFPAGAWQLDDPQPGQADDVVRRVTQELDVATVGNTTSPPASGNPLTNDTSGADTITGNEAFDTAYGQGGNDNIHGNDGDDHLEGNAADDALYGDAGQDDLIGGSGRSKSDDTSAASIGDGRIDEADATDGNDTIQGGDGAGGVAGASNADSDAIAGDNASIDRTLDPITANSLLPANGEWQETSWNAPSVRRPVRLYDVATSTADAGAGTNGADTINGEASDDTVFGQGGNDVVTGDDANLGAASAADANPGDDYVEGNGGFDTIRGDLGQDDITGGGSAANGVLDADRDGRLDSNRSGETLRDLGDEIEGDSGDTTAGAGDVVAGDNARIQRLLDGNGAWRTDSARGTTLRDVFLFDVRIVGSQAGGLGDAQASESGFDRIDGNGGNDILLGQDNGQSDDAAGDAYGREDISAGAPNCQTSAGPGRGAITGGLEFPSGDEDGDKLPDLNDLSCRTTNPAGDTVSGEDGQDYVEGNAGSDNLYGGEGEDDVVGGSSTSSALTPATSAAIVGHLNVILPPADRDTTTVFQPGSLDEASKPYNLNDGHDYIQGNREDDALLGDNGFVDRYTAGGAWFVIAGPGGGPYGETGNPNPEPGRGVWTSSELVRRDAVTRATREDTLAFGNDHVLGQEGKDDVYGLLGNDWLEGNDGEDAIVGDMGKIVNNQLGPPPAGFDPDGFADPSPLNQFITPQQPFLGSTINYTGMLKREVTLYAFDQSQAATAGIGHDVAQGGGDNDSIHTGPGEDLANGNGGDDHVWLGDNAEDKLTDGNVLAHDEVDAGWGGGGHDHVWGGYGADYLDVRPRTTGVVPGLFPASDPETWFQVAGGEPSQTNVLYAQDNFDDIDYIYGGWDQDTLQANKGDNGPVIGDRLLDWGGSYNGYYLCPSTYGDWVSTRALAPGVISFLQQMSQGDGATTTATAATSGFRETAIVFTNEQKFNTKPIHPDTPAHFTCGPGTDIP